jgi:CPA2 family monovalent cation:H+ antiporter-2/glutathione-regulated potassium-efflux system ancillary protein KefC
VEREVFEASLKAGTHALVELGTHPFKAERQARAFRNHDRRTLDALRDNWHDGGMDTSYVDASRQQATELFNVMQSDRLVERHDASDRGWTPPPKGDAEL